MARSQFVYVTYIRTTADKLWAALTADKEFMRQYWFGNHCVSTWKPGATWTMLNGEGQVLDDGEIVEAEPPKKMVIRWHHRLRPELAAEGWSQCVMELEPSGASVKLSITHSSEREGSKLITAVSGGWPKILASLKSLIETGDAKL